MKTDWKSIIFQAILYPIITIIISGAVLFFNRDDFKIYIGNPVNTTDSELTLPISIKNFNNNKIIENINLCLPDDAVVKQIDSNIKYNFDNKTRILIVYSLKPNEVGSIFIHLKNQINSSDIRVSSPYKFSMDVLKDEKPFTTEIIISVILSTIIYFLFTLYEIWGRQKLSIHFKEEQKKTNKDIKNLQGQLSQTEKKIAKVDERLLRQKLYFVARISDYSKELSFWRNAIRKLLYSYEKNFDSSEQIINVVTKELKTFTTLEKRDYDFDTLKFLSEKVYGDNRNK